MTVAEKARKVKETVREPVEKARETVGDAADASEAVSDVVDKASGAVDEVSDVAGKLSGGGLLGKLTGGGLSGLLEKLTGGGLLGKVTQALTGGEDAGGEDRYTKKMRHIIKEHQDIAVPRSRAYNQWTQLEDLPTFLKAVTSVEQSDEVISSWTVKIGLSERSWDAEITEQLPDRRIAWKSTGGTEQFGVVSFHALDDELCRVQVEMEYHPHGIVEQVGSILLAPRKRARKELRLFKHRIELEGEETGAWRGEIRNGEVVSSGDGEQSSERGSDESAEQRTDERSHADAEQTRDELYARAKELGIEGRSSMSKQELADAINEHASDQ